MPFVYETQYEGINIVSTSKFCSVHKNKGGATEIQLDLRPVTRSIAMHIPRIIATGEGCKEDRYIRFYQRTAGMFYLFRPGGIRKANFEM